MAKNADERLIHQDPRINTVAWLIITAEAKSNLMYQSPAKITKNSLLPSAQGTTVIAGNYYQFMHGPDAEHKRGTAMETKRQLNCTPTPEWHGNRSSVQQHTSLQITAEWHGCAPVHSLTQTSIAARKTQPGCYSTTGLKLGLLGALHRLLLATAEWHGCALAHKDTSQPPGASKFTAYLLSRTCNPHCYCSTLAPYSKLSPDADAAAANLKVTCSQTQQQQVGTFAQVPRAHQQLRGTETAADAEQKNGYQFMHGPDAEHKSGTAMETKRQLNYTAAAAYQHLQRILTRLLIGTATTTSEWHGNRSCVQQHSILQITAEWQGCAPVHSLTQRDISQPSNTSVSTAHCYQPHTARTLPKHSTHMGSETTDTKDQNKCQQNTAATQNKQQGGTSMVAQKTHLLPAAQQELSGQTTTVAAHSTWSKDEPAWHSCAQPTDQRVDTSQLVHADQSPDDEAYLAQPTAQPLHAKQALHTPRLPHRSGTATLTKFFISFICFTGIGRTTNSAQPPCTEHHYTVPVPMPLTDSTSPGDLSCLATCTRKPSRTLTFLLAAHNLAGTETNKQPQPHATIKAPNAHQKEAEFRMLTFLLAAHNLAETEQPQPQASTNAPNAHQKQAQLMMPQMLLLLLYACTKLCSQLWDCTTNYTILGCILFVETATTAIPMRRFLLLIVLHTSPCQENSICQSRLFFDTVYADEQVPLGESYKGMSLNIHCNTAACCCN